MPFETFEPEKPVKAKANKPRILYVEDEDTNWEVTQLALRDHYELERAHNDEEAFGKIREREFELVLMDIQLSGAHLDGIQITQVLRDTYTGALPPYARGMQRTELPIVFVTAYASAYRREDLMDFGGNETVYKPVDLPRLQLVLSRLILRKLKRTAEATGRALQPIPIEQGDPRKK